MTLSLGLVGRSHPIFLKKMKINVQLYNEEYLSRKSKYNTSEGNPDILIISDVHLGAYGCDDVRLTKLLKRIVWN